MDLQANNRVLRPATTSLSAQEQVASRFGARLHEFLQTCPQGCRSFEAVKGSHVYKAGERGDSIFYIRSGLVALLSTAGGDNKYLIDVVGAGDIFGELSLRGSNTRLESAVVLKHAVMIELPLERFLSVLQETSQLEHLVQHLANRLQQQLATINDLLASRPERL